MELLPELRLGWLNGWIPIAAFYVPFFFLMLVWPREIVRKLYAVSGWSREEQILSLAGKPFSLASMVLMIFAPLKLGEPVFWVGGVVFLVGYILIFVALFNYRNTPADQPVERGVYRYSRNPQWLGLLLMFLGIGVMTGAGLVVLLLLTTTVFYHFRIRGEERACLAAYGEPYRQHLEKVPRYFAIL